MPSTFEFCLPTSATSVPDRAISLHEVKGTPGGGDSRQIAIDPVVAVSCDQANAISPPWIVEAAVKNRHRQFVIDGEAVVFGIDGIPDFNALHSRQHDEEVQQGLSISY